MNTELFPTPVGVADDDPILALPKVSLHDHLDGGLRPGTIVELAAEVGHTLPVDDAEGLRTWFSEAASSGNLEKYLETFAHTLAVMQTSEALTRVAREWVCDQVADGVIYAEARWAPEQHLTKGMDMDTAVLAVRDGLRQGEQLAREAGKTIQVGQIISAMRQAENSLAVAELALRHRDNGVVGFDIAGPEDGFPPEEHRAAFDQLHRECFPVTIHAGEAAGLDSLHGAVQICHAQRLGHGVRIVEDIPGLSDYSAGSGTSGTAEMGKLAHWVRNFQIPLEVCPSSNLQTGVAQSIGEHPVSALKALGFAITINPDNRLMSATSVSREMRLLQDQAGWGTEDFLDITRMGLASAFIPWEQKQKLLTEVVIPGFAQVIR